MCSDLSMTALAVDTMQGLSKCVHEAYTVIFVEQPSCHSLDICENKWYHLIDAQINIQNMILPHVK